MIIFSHTITDRLTYIADFIGKEITGEPITVTSNIEEYRNAGSPKINYSPEKIADNECWMQPHGLLFEKGIKEQLIDCFETNGYKAFFKTDGDLPFDVFAASFYLLSRYEEYLPHQKDIYGRYAHENSVAFKENFLNIPLVNTWLQQFTKILQQQSSSVIDSPASFTFLPTYDIDEAYSYKHKSWWRNTGGAVKDLLRGNRNDFSLRQKVIRNKEKDPFDAYDWMDELHRSNKLHPRYFFLVAAKNSRYDKNISPENPAMKQLIKRQAQQYAIGVHPSWQCGDDGSLIEKEKTTIAKISGQKITASRQHFIRLSLPQTFRQLLAAGITDDYSMGYGSINGFRASVASSFYWYDLEREQTTSLLLHPFCYMEANSYYEQKITPSQALEEMRHYYNEVKKVNGTLITIWHNTFLGTAKKFEGWRQVYQQFINEIQH